MIEDLYKDFRVQTEVYLCLIKLDFEFQKKFLDWIKKNKKKTFREQEELRTGIKAIHYGHDVFYDDLKQFEGDILNK